MARERDNEVEAEEEATPDSGAEGRGTAWKKASSRVPKCCCTTNSKCERMNM